MITYDEYDILGDTSYFESFEDLKSICNKSTIKELETYHQVCLIEGLYEYANYIKHLLKCQNQS